jgi:RIO kinase 1
VQSTVLSAPRAAPTWLVDGPFEDRPRGTLKSGKEAEIFLVERVYAGHSSLLAHKRYRPRYPSKGELRARGFSNSTSYRSDAVYKAGWFLPTRDKRAVMGGSRYGHELASRLWPIQEWTMLERAWASGASVPYPVERTDDGLLMEFIGDETMAAPKLAQARLSATELVSAWDQLLDSLRALTAAGLVHADLSAYNLLSWEGRLVVIDLPQAVEFTTNTDAYDLLHRDLANVAGWFARRGVSVDFEETYAELLALSF